MSRPSAEIILSREVTDYMGLDILTAQGLWAVVYKSRPFNIKQRYWSMNGELTKYPKTVYPSLAPAKNLAKKLNEQFFTEDFTAVKIL